MEGVAIDQVGIIAGLRRGGKGGAIGRFSAKTGLYEQISETSGNFR